MNNWLFTIGRTLDAQLFVIGETQVRVSTLVTVVVMLAITVKVAQWFRSLIDRALTRRNWPQGDAGTVAGLARYLILIIGFGLAIETAGIDLTALFAAGALFAVGLGFAMQSIAQNFVAGVIILSERSIKPGDILRVEGQVVKVLDIGIRASVTQTLDGEDLIIPNSVLIQTTVTNHTLKDSTYRIRVQVGLSYSSDMTIVKDTLIAIAKKVSQSYAVSGHPPQVIMVEFGDNAVNWEVALWMDDPWSARVARSALHEAIWWALKEKGLEIAFPQLDIHLDKQVMAGIEQLSKRAA